MLFVGLVVFKERVSTPGGIIEHCHTYIRKCCISQKVISVWKYFSEAGGLVVFKTRVYRILGAVLKMTNLNGLNSMIMSSSHHLFLHLMKKQCIDTV